MNFTQPISKVRSVYKILTFSGLGILNIPIFGDFFTKKVIGRFDPLSEVVTIKLSGLTVACIIGKTSKLSCRSKWIDKSFTRMLKL